MSKSILIFMLIGVLLLSSCTPGLPVSKATETPDIVKTASVLSTDVSSTVVAAVTQTAEAIPPTETPEPTVTPVPDTATPTAGVPTIVMISPTAPATLAPTRVVVTIAPRITNTPGPWSCSITKQALKWGEHMPPGAEFDGRWTVKNTGTETWDPGALYYQYMGGTKMQTHGDSFKVGKTIKPGQTLDIIVDLQAPKDNGYYHMDWAVTYGDTTLCYLPVDIRVW